VRRRIFSLAAAFCLLSGCAAHAREPEGLTLARVLGVDGGETVTLTAVCAGADQEEDILGTVSAGTLDEARWALPWSGEREMALTNLSYIVIGETADLEETLAYVLSDHEMSPSATVWLAEDAERLLTECADPVARLAVITEQGTAAPTVVNALAALRLEGQVTLPVLTDRDGRLETAGELVWEAAA
jgi:hypothetical protein